MPLTDSRQCYLQHVARLKSRLDAESALRAAIGGEFVAMGTLEHELLRSLGLGDGQYVVDVGCGSGRLAYQLTSYDDLRYTGVDVVPDLLEYAACISGRRDWRFELTDGRSIPTEAGIADFVCFFSVFTHVPLEHAFQYLTEAKRVLRAGGQVVFSFLEFRIPCHWEQFQTSARHNNAGQHLNQFMDRETITVWAERLGLAVEWFADGDRPHIPLSREVQFDSGHVMREYGNLGQSVAVLRKPADTAQNRANGSAPVNGATTECELDRVPAAPLTSSGVSARAYVGAGDGALIVGFVVKAETQPILIRATGPGLRFHGVGDQLQQIHLTLHDLTGRCVVDSANVISPAAPQRADAPTWIQSGAHGDIAVRVSLPAGVYTVVVRGKDGAVGNALAEVYEVT